MQVRKKPRKNSAIQLPNKPKFPISDTKTLVAPRGLSYWIVSSLIYSALLGNNIVGMKLMKDVIKLFGNANKGRLFIENIDSALIQVKTGSATPIYNKASTEKSVSPKRQIPIAKRSNMMIDNLIINFLTLIFRLSKDR